MEDEEEAVELMYLAMCPPVEARSTTAGAFRAEIERQELLE